MNPIYEPKTLLAAIELLPSAGNFLTKTFFSKEETYNTRMIEVDLVKGGRPLAPYVSPVREGVVMKKQGKKTTQIKLPYLKPKYDISAVEAALRAPGENPYSQRTPAQRAEEMIGKRLMEGKNAITRTIEVQAAQSLIQGKVIAKGKDDNDQDWSVEVDWERDPGNTITKAPAGYWTLADVDPIADLRAWRQSLFRTGSRYADVAVLGWDVLNAFLGNPNVQKLLDNRRMNVGQALMENKGNGVTHAATIEGLDIFGYTDWYEDPLTGAVTDMIPGNALVMGCRETSNGVNYGAILDMSYPAGRGIERKIFPKTWSQEDPSVVWLLLQSSPLATLCEPDSALAAYPIG